VEQRVMDGAATRAIVTRSNTDQPSQVYLADAPASGSRG
jgi:dipeptidyl-peptidase-4